MKVAEIATRTASVLLRTEKFCLKSLCILVPVLLASASQSPQFKRRFELQGASPDFWKLIDREAKLETVASGFGFTEGPVWHPTGFIYVSDESRNKIFAVYLDGRKKGLIDIVDPDGNTFDRDGRLIDCASVLRAIIRLTPDGKYTVLADRYQEMRFNSPNDVVIGPDGSLYFTDPTLDLPPGQKQEIPFQGVYRLEKTGAIQLHTKELSQPNGLAFSPDGKKLYVDDSQQRNIRVYDFASGALSNGRIFGEEPGGKHAGVPDGMKVDRDGNIFVTGPNGIWVWDSAGRHLGTIVIPEQPANLTWGDKDYRTLYITATTSVYRLRTLTHGFLGYMN